LGINYNPGIVTNGLVLCLDAGNPRSYPGTGTTWYDVSSDNTKGTVANGASYNNGNLGAFVFDGIDDYVDCGNPISCQLSTALTLESWVNPTSTSGLGNIIQKNLNNGYRCRIENGNLWAHSSGIAAVSSGSPCSNGAWWHCVATFGPAGIACYVNGVSVASNSNPYAPSNATAGNVQLGCFTPGSETFNGKIAIAKIYNRVLSLIEIQQNFNATRGRYGI